MFVLCSLYDYIQNSLVEKKMKKRILHTLIFSTLLLGLILMITTPAFASANTISYKHHEKIATVELPLVTAWYDGKIGYYIQTEASDPAVAMDQGVNLVPKLTDAIAAGVTDDIYVVTNYEQANIIPSAPIPTGPNNADPEYTPLWQVDLVTWNSGATPHTLRSEDDVNAAEASGDITITQTTIVVNCPVIFTRQGGTLPTADIDISYKHHEKIATVELPLVTAWYDGKIGYYIQTEASDPAVAMDQGVNLVPKLTDAIAAGVTDDIYVVTNYEQANIIPSAPIPTGPNNADPEYTPLWQVDLVTWNSGATPHTLRSEDDVNAAEASGDITITQTTIVVNCPVIFTRQGGTLPTADIDISYKIHTHFQHYRWFHCSRLFFMNR